MRRWAVYAASGVAVAAVLLPAVTDRDSFPLSSYPMFSYDLGRVSGLDSAVGFDADGEQQRLSPELIAGGYEPVHAVRTLMRAIEADDTDALCDEIAARARGRGLVRIEVVTETYDSVAWFDGDKTPIDRVVHSTCAVEP